MEPYLALSKVSIRYPVFTSSRHQSILTAVATTASFGTIRHSSAGMTHVSALQDISIELKDGARVGVIGRNGSGKSTLLKALAGINWPSSGNRQVKGRISSVLTIGSGLDAEKSGRANVMFICKLFGIGKAEAEAMAEHVKEFTGLNDFFDMPTRTYSSGMMVRLSFAISTALPGEILIIDEVLGAGDLHFLERAAAHMRERAGSARILVMATHAYLSLVEFSDAVIWIEKGRIVDYGLPADVWKRYHEETPRFPNGFVGGLSFPLKRSAIDTVSTHAEASAEPCDPSGSNLSDRLIA